MQLDLNNLILLAIAGLNAYVAYMAWKTKTKMDVLEKNTNSIKDALVASVGTEKFEAGKKEARLEGELRAATLAEGQRMAAQGPQEVEVVNPEPLPVAVVDAPKKKGA